MNCGANFLARKKSEKYAYLRRYRHFVKKRFWCLVMVEWLFLAVPWGCQRFVIVVYPDHTHLLFLRHLLGVFWYLGSGVVLDCIDS